MIQYPDIRSLNAHISGVESKLGLKKNIPTFDNLCCRLNLDINIIRIWPYWAETDGRK